MISKSDAIARKAILFPLLAFLVITSSPILHVLPWTGWHDQQRIGQITVIVLGAGLAFYSLFAPPLRSHLAQGPRTFLIILALAGVASSLLSRQPEWAFAELAIALGCLGIAWMVAVTRDQLGATLDKLLLGFVFFICVALTLRFFASYAALLITRNGMVDPWLLLDGFSNLRFYGQFISLSLPLLAAPILMQGRLKRFAVPAAIVLVLWWAIAITSGTRGTWLGLSVAAACLLLAGLQGRRWVVVNAMAALLGVLVFRFWMEWLPDMTGLPVTNHAADRLSTSLSGREPLWQQAIDMILAKPLLGFGPMHFADIANRIAAHPHQAWLQWASEWGLPSALIVSWLVWLAARAVFRVMRERAGSSEEVDVLRVCLAGSITASLTQSMVDGVLVMPYTQTWLALLAGWLFALHPRITSWNDATIAGPLWRWGWALALASAAGFLVFIAARDVPHLGEREQAYVEAFGGHMKPRFWLQGVIAEKP